MDSAEDTLDADEKKFKEELLLILDDCPWVQLLFTSRKNINSIDHIQEFAYQLYQLTPKASITLLFEKTKRRIDEKEIRELLKQKLPNDHKLMEVYGRGHNEGTTLIEHPFIFLLGGHPQAISLAASMLQYKSLTELFLEFLNNDFGALDLENNNTTTNSL